MHSPSNKFPLPKEILNQHIFLNPQTKLKFSSIGYRIYNLPSNIINDKCTTIRGIEKSTCVDLRNQFSCPTSTDQVWEKCRSHSPQPWKSLYAYRAILIIKNKYMNETSLKSTNKVFCFNSKDTGKAKKLSKTVQLKKKNFTIQCSG